MNEKKTLTWREIFKGMPAYMAEGFRKSVAYWRKASLRMWVAEILWLIILVAMFYYGAYGIVNYYESVTNIDPNSAFGWFISFLPIYFIFVIFIVHWMFSSLVSTVFKLMDSHGS